LSLSSHSQATPESVEVASNGRPWRIMTSVVEVVSIINTIQDNENDIDQFVDLSEDEELPIQEDLGAITGQNRAIKRNGNDENVMPFRSGSINPNT